MAGGSCFFVVNQDEAEDNFMYVGRGYGIQPNTSPLLYVCAGWRNVDVCTMVEPPWVTNDQGDGDVVASKLTELTGRTWQVRSASEFGFGG